MIISWLRETCVKLVNTSRVGLRERSRILGCDNADLDNLGFPRDLGEACKHKSS